MRTALKSITLVTLWLAANISAVGQAPPQPAPPIAPTPPVAPAPPVRPVGQPVPVGGGGGGGFGGKGVVSPAPGAPQPAFTDRLQQIIARAGGSGPTDDRALVIMTANADPAAIAQTQEDMRVMAHILDKSVRAASRPSRPGTAMGVDLLFAPGTEPARDLFLEGHGAVFMLRVGFPLMAPRPREEAGAEETTADSTWEAAKRELRGEPAEGSMAPMEPFSEEKVEDLKNGIFEALKNAVHIRALKENESITVCVFGGPVPAPGKVSKTVETTPKPTREARDAQDQPQDAVATGTAPPSYQWRKNSSQDQARVVASGPQTSIFTLQVKRSDVESFAKGKLDVNEFQKKARMAVYASSPGSGPGMGGYGGFGGGGWGGAYGPAIRR